MSRDILFKAKRKDNGEWVEGDLFHTYANRVFIAKMSHNNMHEVIHDTICQYTGLTDKNGNTIWENDIIQYKDIKALGKVEYIEDSFYLKYVYDCKQYIGGMWNKFEVIGNIFDNPELLEGGA